MKRRSDEVYSVTEPKRHSCEVNHVSKQSGEWIKEYLEKVKEKRGFEIYKKLRDDVKKLWRNNGTGKN